MPLQRRDFIGLTTASVLVACAPKAPADAKTKTLNASLGLPEPNTMFSPAGGGNSPAFTSSKVLERLFRMNRDQTYSPLLASAWAIEDGGRKVMITLREGVKWHDGAPLTPADVIWSANNYWKPFAPETILERLTEVAQVGEDQVSFVFSTPILLETFQYLLGAGLYYVLPKTHYEGSDILLNPLNNAPIGTGPWKFSKWVRGSHAEFLKNEFYWKPGQPKMDKLIIRWFREPATRVAALETGELDIAVQSPAALNDVARLRSNPALKVQFDEDVSGGGTLFFNTRRKPFDDPDVRRALLFAIDRNFIVNTIYAGFAKPAISPIYSNNKRYFTEDVPRYPFDRARAEALLDAAGHRRDASGKRFTLQLLASGWYEENGKVATYLAQAWQAIGVPVTLRNPDRPNSLKALYKDYDFDVAYSQSGGVSGEPLPTLALNYGTAGIQKGLSFRNASRFSDPETDRLLAAIAKEIDPSVRKGLVQAFARRVTDLAPTVPVVELRPHTIYRQGVVIGDVGYSISLDSWGDISKT